VKSVFVDTRGFNAFLDCDDRFHAEAKRLFLKSKNIPHSRLGTVIADPSLSIQAAGNPFKNRGAMNAK
jgi:hypothetical protein